METISQVNEPPKTALDIHEILKILPHRYPLLLIDRVLELKRKESIVAIKNVTINEPFFNGHFPGLPIMPGVLQIEAMAQAACLAFQRQGDPPMDYFIAGIRDAKFRRPVVPGDVLTLHAEIVKDRGSILIVKAEA